MALDSIRELVDGESNRSQKAEPRVTSGGLRIRCFANLSMDMEVPKVSAELQESINDIVQHRAGGGRCSSETKYRNDEGLSLVQIVPIPDSLVRTLFEEYHHD